MTVGQVPYLLAERKADQTINLYGDCITGDLPDTSTVNDILESARENLQDGLVTFTNIGVYQACLSIVPH